MRQYQHEDDPPPGWARPYHGGDSQTKLPDHPASHSLLQKHGEVKKGFDFLITTPGKLRKGVARHGDQLRGFTDYNLKLFRGDDKLWALYIEWVDLDGEGHRIVLPHPVVAGVLQRANSIIAQCRKERAQRAALTRKQKRGETRWEKAGEIHVTHNPQTESTIVK